MTAAPTIPMSPPRTGQPPLLEMMSWQAWLIVAGFTLAAIGEFYGIKEGQTPEAQADFKKRTISALTWWLGSYHRDSYNAPHAKWRRLAVDTVFMWFPGHVRSAGKRY